MRQDGDERELFLVKLLIGMAVKKNHDQNEAECKRIVAPPFNPASEGLRYDTVSGEVGGSNIHAVYENGRAYPAYLIRYYKGRRDPSRTPYETQSEAMEDMKVSGTERTYSSDVSEVFAGDVELGSAGSNSFRRLAQLRQGQGHARTATHTAGGNGSSSAIPADQENSLWMYEDDAGNTHPMAAEVQATIEAAYMANPRGSTSFTVEESPWIYDVDFLSMIQTNRDHPNHRQRRVHRVILR